MITFDRPPHFPAMKECERDSEIERLKKEMRTWDAKSFRDEYDRIREKLQGGSDMAELEHPKEATRLMLRWQAMREYLEEQLACTNK